MYHTTLLPVRLNIWLGDGSKNVLLLTSTKLKMQRCFVIEVVSYVFRLPDNI